MNTEAGPNDGSQQKCYPSFDYPLWFLSLFLPLIPAPPLHGTHSFDNSLCTLSFMGKYCFEMFLLKSCLYWIFYFILLKTLNSIWLKSQYGIEWLMVKKVAALKLKGNNQTTYYKGIFMRRECFVMKWERTITETFISIQTPPSLYNCFTHPIERNKESWRLEAY